MPNCRHCGSRLSRFDKDMCPVCGCKHPFDGVSQETCDVTQEINALDEKEINFRRFSHKNALLLSLPLGFLGVPFFYLKYKLYGVLHLIAHLAILGLIIICFAFFGEALPIWAKVIIPIGFILISNITLGFILFFKKDLKDGRGEYLS